MKNRVMIMAAATLLASSAAYAGGDPAAGKAKSGTCSACHGTTGTSMIPNYPNLCGQKEKYLVKAIHDYKSGARTEPLMKPMVASLTDSDIENLAAYFSSQKCQ